MRAAQGCCRVAASSSARAHLPGRLVVLRVLARRVVVAVALAAALVVATQRQHQVAARVPDGRARVARAHDGGAALPVHAVWRLCELAAQPAGVVGGRGLAKDLRKQVAQRRYAQASEPPARRYVRVRGRAARGRAASERGTRQHVRAAASARPCVHAGRQGSSRAGGSGLQRAAQAAGRHSAVCVRALTWGPCRRRRSM